MNFMDYSDDIALTMFSQGQVDRMNYTLSVNGLRSSFRNIDNKANIYRFANNSIHRYDRNVAAFPSTAVEGVLGRISQTQLPNTFPLFKFETASGDTYFHFANTMPNYPQYILKGISGYASKTAQPGTGMVPIYEYWGFNHHFYTNNPNELGAAGGTTGWTKAPVTFYLFQ